MIGSGVLVFFSRFIQSGDFGYNRVGCPYHTIVYMVNGSQGGKGMGFEMKLMRFARFSLVLFLYFEIMLLRLISITFLYFAPAALQMFMFGGYGGTGRLDDFWEFDFGKAFYNRVCIIFAILK